MLVKVGPVRQEKVNQSAYCRSILFDVCYIANVHPWWRHQIETFSALLAICAGNSPVPVNSPYNGQWRGTLMFSLICVWINGWVNNREAGDLRRYRAHYDVTVMQQPCERPAVCGVMSRFGTEQILHFPSRLWLFIKRNCLDLRSS